MDALGGIAAVDLPGVAGAGLAGAAVVFAGPVDFAAGITVSSIYEAWMRSSVAFVFGIAGAGCDEGVIDTVCSGVNHEYDVTRSDAVDLICDTVEHIVVTAKQVVGNHSSKATAGEIGAGIDRCTCGLCFHH